MKLEDFHIGLHFRTAVGHWKCTDVGQRTVVAILMSDDRHSGAEVRWNEGPPYGLQEQVLDEEDWKRAFSDLDQATWDAITERQNHPHRSIDSNEMWRQLERRIECLMQEQAGGPDAYPMNTLKGMRVRAGEEFRAYGAHRNASGEWLIECFNYHRQASCEIAEADWLGLPLVVED